MICVVVPARNEEQDLGACLAALMAQEGDPARMEILVVDDASTDGTLEIARRLAGRPGSRVRVIAGPGRGASAARNAGARAASAPILLFTDADCRPVPGWASALERALEADGVAAVTGRQASDQRGVVARLVQLEVDEKHRRLRSGRRAMFADTASAGYRADVFRALGGFDEGLRRFEDTDLAFRLVSAGHAVEIVPGAVVYHRHVENLLAYFRRKRHLGLWGAAVYRRHPARLLEDSRTPWSMRLQMAFAPLTLLGLAAGAWTPAGHGPAALAAVLFLASAGRFLASALRLGPAMAMAALPFLATRALALDVGLAEGLIRILVGRHPATNAP